MIGIIGAMKQEVEMLKEMIENPQSLLIAHVEFTTGKLFGKEVVLLQSGIGKVNVAIATTLLLEKFAVTKVINTGSAGGVTPKAKTGDIVISEEVIYHDVDVTGFGYKRGQIPSLPAEFKADPGLIEIVQQVLSEKDMRYFRGQIATGDAFIAKAPQLGVIKYHFPQVIAIEMEAAAVAQVCYQYKIPFIIIRSLSDIAGKDSTTSFESFLPAAAKASTDVVCEVVKIL